MCIYIYIYIYMYLCPGEIPLTDDDLPGSDPRSSRFLLRGLGVFNVEINELSKTESLQNIADC